VSVDAGNPIPDFTPQGVDLFVPTVEALVRTYGQRSPDRLLDAALADGADTVVATQGGDGSIAATRDGGRHHAPAHRSPILSTLGAGDVFHGALLAAVVGGSPLDSALVTANTVAAMSCAGLDGRSAIPRREELDQVLPSLSH
jgi:sugar/nucleoside kinase (ribokinase family)